MAGEIRTPEKHVILLANPIHTILPKIIIAINWEIHAFFTYVGTFFTKYVINVANKLKFVRDHYNSNYKDGDL